MNAITIELCAEDRARLDRLAAALERRPNCEGCVSSALEAAGLQRPLAPVPEKPVTETTADLPFDPDPPVAAPPSPVAEISLGDFQNALTLRCAESETMKAKVRALLNQYAAAASAVPPEKRAEIMEKLAKL